MTSTNDGRTNAQILNAFVKAKNMSIADLARVSGVAAGTIYGISYSHALYASRGTYDRLHAVGCTLAYVQDDLSNSMALTLYMEEHQITIEELAKKSGIKAEALQAILDGAYRVGASTKKKADAIGLTLKYPLSKAEGEKKAKAKQAVVRPVDGCGCGAKLTRNRTVIVDGEKMCGACYERFWRAKGLSW